MNLIDERRDMSRNSKKMLMICGIGIVILLFIIIALLAYVTTLNNNKSSLKIDGKEYSTSDYLLVKDNVTYIGIEDLTKLTNSGYSYKSGDKNIEDENKCYITNLYESTFFNVNSNQIYKVLEDTNETEYYTLENNIIKEKDKIYIPLNSIKTAMNCSVINNNNKIEILSITYLESFYNQTASTTFVPNDSIVWETTYSNKKLLKDGLVIVQDEVGNLGLAEISYTVAKKNKANVTTITTKAVITPKYTSIKYIEKFNQLIVGTEDGKGIVQLEENNGKYSVKTKIIPQYETLKQINENLYVVGESVETTENNTTKKVIKYGIVNSEGEIILSTEYDKIGIDISDFTNNGLNNEYIIYEKYIPVNKDGLWGLVNLQGKVVVKLEYSGLGYVGTNSSSNVLIIPELNAIVVKKDNNYGIINTSGKVLMKNVLTRVYKETSSSDGDYVMVYNDKKYNAVEYIKNNVNVENKNTNTNTTTNTTNKQTTNTTTNKNTTTNATNTIVVNKTTN